MSWLKDLEDKLAGAAERSIHDRVSVLEEAVKSVVAFVENELHGASANVGADVPPDVTSDPASTESVSDASNQDVQNESTSA